MEDIESSPEYSRAFQIIKDLYQTNKEFRAEIQGSTAAALRSTMKRKHGVGKDEERSSESSVDIEEGVNYMLKEMAFHQAVPSIYERCDEYICVYHRPAPVFEKYFGGHYDNVVKPCFGFFIFE